MKPEVSIVVPSRGRADKLERLLEKLAWQSIRPEEAFEVVVGLDGYSADEAAALPRRFPFAVHYLALPRVGISAAKNAAVARARGAVLIFLNDDVEPASDFVHQHVLAQSAGQGLVLGASPWKRFADETVLDACIARTRMIFFYEDLRGEASCDFRHAWNLNLSIRRDLLVDASRPFAEQLRPCMFEDVELAYRLIGAGDGVFYQPAARAEHNHRYSLVEYLRREAMLGVMAGELFAVNPECFRAIFGCDHAELIEQALAALAIDVRDAQRCLAQVSRLATREHTTSAHDALLPLLYAAHLPLKRRAFRGGLLAAAHNEVPWTERGPLAHAALRDDPVFGEHLTTPAVALPS